jgi:hypothetical protein
MTDRQDATVLGGQQHTDAAPTTDVGLDELRRAIIRLAAPVLAGAGVATDRAACRLEPSTTRLEVRIDLPIAVSPATKQALGVRVLDAVRSAGRTFGSVRVSVHDPT